MKKTILKNRSSVQAIKSDEIFKTINDENVEEKDLDAELVRLSERLTIADASDEDDDLIYGVDELPEEEDFFETMRLPSISEFTPKKRRKVKKEEEERKSDKPKVRRSVSEAIGAFVDPLTGVQLESSSEEEEEEEEQESSESFDERTEEMDDETDETDMHLSYKGQDIIEDNELLIFQLRDEQEKDEMEVVVKDETDVVSKYLEVILAEPEKPPEIDWEELARVEAERLLHEAITNFIYSTADRVTEFCEYVDPIEVMRQNLDKKKIIMEFRERMNQIELEHARSRFLNRKVVEYYRRKRLFKMIAEEDYTRVKQLLAKYDEVLKTLATWVAKDEKVRATAEETITDLQMQIQEAKEVETMNIIELENLFRRTFIRDNTFRNMKEAVEKHISKMGPLRDQIQTMRKEMLGKQHVVARLQNQLNALESLGEDLTLQDYNNLQTEIFGLEKKIEERDSDLIKMRGRCNADIHILAHIKEKLGMLKNQNVKELANLTKLNEQRATRRKHLYQLKLQRGKLRKEWQEASLQGGLLDKPALMYDYDNTLESIAVARQRVEKKRETFALLTKKVAKLEKKCLQHGIR